MSPCRANDQSSAQTLIPFPRFGNKIQIHWVVGRPGIVRQGACFVPVRDIDAHFARKTGRFPVPVLRCFCSRFVYQHFALWRKQLTPANQHSVPNSFCRRQFLLESTRTLANGLAGCQGANDSYDKPYQPAIGEAVVPAPGARSTQPSTVHHPARPAGRPFRRRIAKQVVTSGRH